MIKNIGLGIVTAGIIGAGALGLAGTAAAATTVTTGSDYSYSPDTKAHPAPTMLPGWQAHHGPARIEILQNP